MAFQQLELPSTPREIARLSELRRLGRTPRDLMLDNMLFWARRARFYEREAEKTWKTAEQFDEAELEHLDEKGQKDYRRRMGEARGAADNALAQLKEARFELQKVAASVAPYCHPKFTVVGVRNLDNEDDMPSGEIVDAVPTLIVEFVDGHSESAANANANGSAAKVPAALSAVSVQDR